MSYGIIYLITNLVNGKQYVGQTIHDIELRFRQHCNQKHYISLLTYSINKYGKENFTIEEIDSAENIDELNEKEIYWIAELDTVTPNGLNISHGGGGRSGVKPGNCRKIIDLDTLEIFESITDAGNKYDIHTGHITLVCRGEISHLGGHRFAYLDDYEKGEVPVFKSKLNRKIINLDTLEVFTKISEASKKYNLDSSSITKACRGKIKHSGGYRWAYYEDYINDTIPIKKSHKKKVINVDTEKVYKSLMDAERKTGISSGNICNSCKGRQKASGYRWMYYEDYLEQQNNKDTKAS